MSQRPPPAASESNAGGNIAHTLLSRAHSPSSAARIYNERIKSRPLYLKPSEAESRETRSGRHARRVARIHKLAARCNKLKPQPLTAREKRALGVYEIPKEEQKWSIYEPLNRLWMGYMAEIIGEGHTSSITSGNTNGLLSRLASADFHGAVLQVVRSRCVSRVGIKGIVVRDSKFTFVLVTESDAAKVVPKEHTIFRFEVPLPAPAPVTRDEGGATPVGGEVSNKKVLVFELHGDQFQHRAADRANKKFKTHFLPDL